MPHWLLSDHHTIGPNKKAKGQKSHFSNLLVTREKLGNAKSRLWKNPNFRSLLCIGKNLEIYDTVPDQYFKVQMLNLWMSWENLCSNLTFNV